MLGYLERTAVAAGVESLFALSTHTMQWFMERGFDEAPLESLPERRIAIYDRGRGSKIYVRRRPPSMPPEPAPTPQSPHNARSASDSIRTGCM